MALLDNLASMFGQPDPRMQLMARLGQAPGQPGANTGPAPDVPPPPGALPGGPPSAPPTAGGPPVGQGGPAGPQGPAPGPSQPPPQPQAYMSPPDLMNMYMQLAQRSQANESFNRGIGMMAAAFARPGDRQMMLSSMQGQTQDPGELIGNIMKLQTYGQQQQAYQQLQAAAPALAQQLGVPLNTAQAIIASGKYGDVETTLAGVSGDPSVREMTQARNAWTHAHAVRDANGNPIVDPTTNQPQTDQPIPPTLLSVDQYKQDQAGKVVMAQQRAKDLQADQANFPQAKQAYDRMIGDAQSLLNQPGLDNILGPTGQYVQAGGPLGTFNQANTTNALALYNKIMAAQYAAGVQDFKGAGRITQTELNQDAPSQSIMKARNLTPQNFRAGVQDYINQLQIKRANAFGAAGQLASPDLSDQDYAKVNPIFKPQGDLYVPGQPARAPSAASGTSAPASGAASAAGGGIDLRGMSDAAAAAAYAKVPPGAPYIAPDGQMRQKKG
jgi:hypothetical protein